MLVWKVYSCTGCLEPLPPDLFLKRVWRIHVSSIYSSSAIIGLVFNEGNAFFMYVHSEDIKNFSNMEQWSCSVLFSLASLGSHFVPTSKMVSSKIPWDEQLPSYGCLFVSKLMKDLFPWCFFMEAWFIGQIRNWYHLNWIVMVSKMVL